MGMDLVAIAAKSLETLEPTFVEAKYQKASYHSKGMLRWGGRTGYSIYPSSAADNTEEDNLKIVLLQCLNPVVSAAWIWKISDINSGNRCYQNKTFKIEN